MASDPNFDVQEAHRHFARSCFNLAWDLIEKSDRTADEDREMIRLSHASHWHWTQVSDHTPANISVGFWQASRIYALLGEAENARIYGQLCLEVSTPDAVGPFFVAYAHEALARAAAVAGDAETMNTHLEQARSLAAELKDDDRSHLTSDLETIGK